MCICVTHKVCELDLNCCLHKREDYPTSNDTNKKNYLNLRCLTSIEMVRSSHCIALKKCC